MQVVIIFLIFGLFLVLFREVHKLQSKIIELEAKFGQNVLDLEYYRSVLDYYRRKLELE